jgi:hypothetical protein
MKLDPTSRAAGLAFLVAGVTLSAQILVHRLVSAKLLNNYAFLVISLTMLGFACSSIVRSQVRERAYVAAYPFDISSTEDDRPFFFRYSFWWRLFPSDPMIWANVPLMEMSLLLLAAPVYLAVGFSLPEPTRAL